MALPTAELITITLDKNGIITACIAILTIFLTYFVWKFRTYGIIKAKIELLPKLAEIEVTLAGAKIEGKLAKLNKLEIIEKTLELAKFDTQMQRLSEILELERVKAIGKSSVEFNYQKRRDDSNKLIEFYNKISELNIATIDYYLKNKNDIKHLITLCKNGNSHLPGDITGDEYGRSMINQDIKITDIESQYIFYFSDYEHKGFDTSYLNWKQQIQKTHGVVLNMNAYKMGWILNDLSLHEKANGLEKLIAEPCNTINIHDHMPLLFDVMNQVTELNKTILSTSHNADYV